MLINKVKNLSKFLVMCFAIIFKRKVCYPSIYIILNFVLGSETIYHKGTIQHRNQMKMGFMTSKLIFKVLRHFAVSLLLGNN